MDCYFCSKQVYRQCQLCSKMLCYECQNKPHCQYSCQTCQGKDINSIQYYRNFICQTCIGNYTTASTEVTLWYDYQQKQPISSIKSIVASVLKKEIKESFLYLNSYQRKPGDQDPDICYGDFLNQMERYLIRPVIFGTQQKILFVVSERIQEKLEKELIQYSNKSNTLIIVSDSYMKNIFFLKEFKQNILMKALSKNASQGFLIIHQEKLKKQLQSQNLQKTIQQNISNRNIKEVQLRYPNQVQRFFWVNYQVINRQILFSIVRNLQRIGVEPFINRIQEILLCMFNLDIDQNKLLMDGEVLNMFIRHSENRKGENQALIATQPKVLNKKVIKELDSIPFTKQKQIAKLMFKKHPFKSTFLQAFYFKFSNYSQISKLKLGVIYLIIQKFNQLKPETIQKIPEQHLPQEAEKSIQKPLNLPDISFINHSPIQDLQKLLTNLEFLFQNNPNTTLDTLQNQLLKSIYPQKLDFSLFNYTSLQQLLKQNLPYILESIFLQNCPICYFQLKESIVNFECLHKFHQECLKTHSEQMIERQLPINCPTCKYRPDPGEIEMILGIRTQRQTISLFSQEFKDQFTSSEQQYQYETHDWEYYGNRGFSHELNQDTPRRRFQRQEYPYFDGLQYQKILSKMSLQEYRNYYQQKKDQMRWRNFQRMQQSKHSTTDLGNFEKHKDPYPFQATKGNYLSDLDDWEQKRNFFQRCGRKNDCRFQERQVIRVICPMCYKTVVNIEQEKFLRCDYCTYEFCKLCFRGKDNNCSC